MNEDSDSSSVWDKYVQAKMTVFGKPDEKGSKQNLEELEAAIAQTAASSGLSEMGIPPRSVVHPSKQSQLSRWFYLSLVVIFSSLVIGLVWWGRKHYSE